MIIIVLSFVVSNFLLSLVASFYHLKYIILDNVLKVNQNNFFNMCFNKKSNLLELISPDEKLNIS